MVASSGNIECNVWPSYIYTHAELLEWRGNDRGHGRVLAPGEANYSLRRNDSLMPSSLFFFVITGVRSSTSLNATENYSGKLQV